MNQQVMDLDAESIKGYLSEMVEKIKSEPVRYEPMHFFLPPKEFKLCVQEELIEKTGANDYKLTEKFMEHPESLLMMKLMGIGGDSVIHESKNL